MSFYVLDDINALRQMTSAVAGDDVHLFTPSPATRSVSRGVVLDYFLPRGADQVTLEFLDANGALVRRLTEPPPIDGEPPPDGVTESSRAPVPRLPVRAGMNRFVWDMRAAPLRDFPGLIMYQTDTRGPIVPPGRYAVRLTTGGRTVTAPIVIEKDARLASVSIDDLAEQYRFARQIGDAFSETSDMVARVRHLTVQISDRVRGLSDSSSVTKAAERLTGALTAVEGELYQYQNRSTKDPLNFPPKLNNKIAVLLSAVDTGDGRPTDQSYQSLQSARSEARRREAGAR